MSPYRKGKLTQTPRPPATCVRCGIWPADWITTEGRMCKTCAKETKP